MNLAGRRRMGAGLLLLLAVHLAVKARIGMLPEALWACHVASGVLGLGLLLDSPALSATGFLFHLAVAVPTYALHLMVRGETNWTSFLLHTLSPLAGFLAWRGRPLPAATPWRGWAFYLALLLLCRAATPAHLNVNLAFRPWDPWSFLGTWPSRVLNALLVLGQLHAVHWLLGRRRPEAARA